MPTEHWQFLLSAAIGISLAAGIVLGIRELLWMKRQGQLTRPAFREMAMSLSTLPARLDTSWRPRIACRS